MTYQLQNHSASKPTTASTSAPAKDPYQQAIQAWVDKKKAALKAKDNAAFSKLIDQTNPEFAHEQQHWFDDFISNPITDYAIQVADVKAVDDNTMVASLIQTYKMNSKPYLISFDEVFKKTPEGWVDADLHFMQKETPHFVIEYLPGDEGKADTLADISEQAYNDLTKKLWATPTDRTVLKVYTDKEQLRQSVKLSFAWQFAGWYEYPESVKMMNDAVATPDKLKTRIEHEMTHKGTLTISKNNLPYWLGEGLAESYTDPNIARGAKAMTLADLEKINLEKLTDNNDINDFYATSTAVVQFMKETYGEDKLKALLNELGTHPYNPKTAGESIEQSEDLFHQALPKTLGLDINQFDQAWQAWSKTHLAKS